MSRIRPALLVAGTDLRRGFRNRAFLVMAFGGPLLLATIISLAFGSGMGFDATIGVADADGSPISTGFAEGLTAANEDGLTFREADPDTVRRQVDDGDLDAAIVVPSGFAESLGSDEPSGPLVVTSDGNQIAGEVARAVADGFASRVEAGRLAAATTAAEGGEVPGPGALAGIEMPVTIDQRSSGDTVSLAAYFGPSMGLLFLFLTVGLVARGMLAEKRMRVLDRIRAAPVRTGSILAGKCLSTVVTGVASLSVIWLATTVALGADWGDPVGVVALVVASALAVAGIAGLVAALARTEQGADSLATGVALILALMGGSFVPLGVMPDALRQLSLATPNGWALRGFAELSAGGGTVVDVAPHVAALLAWALVTGTLAARLLPRRLEAA